MSVTLPEFPTAHLDIGRTHDVLGCIPITHIVCRCKQVPLILNGCPSVTTCGACGRVFTLSSVSCKGVMVGATIDARERVGFLGRVQ